MTLFTDMKDYKVVGIGNSHRSSKKMTLKEAVIELERIAHSKKIKLNDATAIVNTHKKTFVSFFSEWHKGIRAGHGATENEREILKSYHFEKSEQLASHKCGLTYEKKKAVFYNQAEKVDELDLLIAKCQRDIEQADSDYLGIIPLSEVK